MKKKIFALLMLACFITSVCAYADVTPVKNGISIVEIVTQVPHMHKMGTLELDKNQSSITLEITELSNPCSNYYISLYDITNENYIIKCAGPVSTDKFTFTGLTPETTYKVSLSSSINIEDVDGFIYAH